MEPYSGEGFLACGSKVLSIFIRVSFFCPPGQKDTQVVSVMLLCKTIVVELRRIFHSL